MANKHRGRNEGSISQRTNGRWRGQISKDGRRLSKDFKIKAEALEWLRNKQIEINRVQNDHGSGSSRMTLGEYLPQWIDKCKTSLRAKTVHEYDRIVSKHILPRLGNYLLVDLRLAKIEEFYSELIQAGVGTRTVRLTHSILRNALEKAVRYELINYNPCQGAILPRYKQGEMQVLDESEVTRFLVAAQDSRYKALYHLAVTTGMRQGELFGLKWSDLQWHSGTLHVQRQVQRINGQEWIFVEPKTRAGRRTIKLGDGALQVLREHKEQQALKKAAAGSRWLEYDLIFPTKLGTPGDKSNLRADLHRVLEKAGLPNIRFHDLRHTAASLWLNHGVAVLVVSKMLGHSKPSITLDVYGHLYHEMQDEAAEIMDKLVTPIQVGLPSETMKVLR